MPGCAAIADRTAEMLSYSERYIHATSAIGARLTVDRSLWPRFYRFSSVQIPRRIATKKEL